MKQREEVPTPFRLLSNMAYHPVSAPKLPQADRAASTMYQHTTWTFNSMHFEAVKGFLLPRVERLLTHFTDMHKSQISKRP
eukprot:12401632-Karenia_brevis.AAC.1